MSMETPPIELPPPMAGRGRLALSTAASYVALGTGVSRVTGLLRIVALAWALGQTHVADAFNLANTTPNMLYDIVLGGVLSATFIPVFVDQLSNRTKEEAFTVHFGHHLGVPGRSGGLHPARPGLCPGLHRRPDRARHALAHRARSTRCARAGRRHHAAALVRHPDRRLWGLRTGDGAAQHPAPLRRRRLGPHRQQPGVHRVLFWFGLLVGRSPTLGRVADHHAQLVLLGLGTSLGVVLQCVALVPSLRTAGLGLLRWHWDLRDAALRTVMRLSGWTFGFVLANQTAQFVVILLAGTAGGADPVSSYTYAYAFLQMPYGIVAVTVMSVVAPDLAERWSTGQRAAFLARLSGGLRRHAGPHHSRRSGDAPLGQARGGPLARPRAQHGGRHGTHRRGPGHVRVRASRVSAPICTWCASCSPCSGPRWPSTSTSLRTRSTSPSPWSWCTRWACAAWPCPFRWPTPWAPCWVSRYSVAGSGPSAPKGPGPRCAGSASPPLAMGIVVLVVSNLSGATDGLFLLGRVVGAIVAGLAVYVAVVVALGRRAASKERERRRQAKESRRLVYRHRDVDSPLRPRRGRLHPCPVCGS